MGKYMQMIYVDKQGNARHTGVGAAMETDALTVAAFKDHRAHAVPFEGCAFLLDLHDDDGSCIDTIALDRKGFEFISQEKMRSDAYYVAYDQKYWRKARAAHRRAA